MVAGRIVNEMVNAAVRRIMAEVRELAADSGGMFVAAPLEGDLFDWHFTVRGAPETAFEGGVYHGRMVLPAEYPLKPPEIMLLTANGRFELNVPICLSVTAHHQESWQPSWGIRTILTALVGFMPTPAEGVGSLDFPDHERRRLAQRSRSFVCKRCGAKPSEQLPIPVVRTCGDASAATGASGSRQVVRELQNNGAPVVRRAAVARNERVLAMVMYAIVVLILVVVGRRVM